MFITSNATPAEIIAELIAPAGATVGDDFKAHAHNDDLCPHFRDRLERVVSSYAKFRTHVDDIQGFNDQGVDVLIQYCDDDGIKHRIGLQIKSYSEIEADLKLPSGKRTLIPLLSAQRTRAQSKHQVEMFYVLLCGDGGKKHRDFVRRVCGEFSSIPDVRVITPAQAWAFYNLEDYEIAAFCTKVLCADDYILRSVFRSFSKMGDAHRRMIVAWIVRQLEFEPELRVDDLLAYAKGDNDENDEGLIEEDVCQILSGMSFDGYAENINGNRFKLLDIGYDELRALYFDLKVRHGLTGQDAIDYLWELTN